MNQIRCPECGSTDVQFSFTRLIHAYISENGTPVQITEPLDKGDLYGETLSCKCLSCKMRFNYFYEEIK